MVSPRLLLALTALCVSAVLCTKAERTQSNKSRSCDVRNDLQSVDAKAYHAPVVFAGTVRSRGSPRASSGLYEVTIEVIRVHKGSLDGGSLRLRYRLPPAGESSTSSRRRRRGCVAEAKLTTGGRYMVFVKAAQAGGVRNYTAVSAPEPHSRQVVRKVTKTVCKNCGLVTVLCQLLEDTDPIVRHKSAECLHLVAGHAVGRDDLLQRDALTHLSWRFTDPVPLVRRNVHRVVVALVRTPEGVEAALTCDLIPQLLDRVLLEHNEIILLCLTSLQPLLREDPGHGLVLGGIATMNTLLQHEISAIRAAAASCLHYLTLPTQGKNEAVVLGSLPLLVELLKDWDSAVRTQAAAATGAILITTPAKMQAMTMPTLEHLLALAKEADMVSGRMLALQALAVLASHPEARRRLRDEVPLFEEAKMSTEEGVRDCAARALEEVLWDP